MGSLNLVDLPRAALSQADQNLVSFHPQQRQELRQIASLLGFLGQAQQQQVLLSPSRLLVPPGRLRSVQALLLLEL